MKAEWIRLKVGGKSEQVLWAVDWSGSEPTKEYFLEFAYEGLKGFYEFRNGNFSPKPEFNIIGGYPIPEAIRLISDNRKTIYQFDVGELVNYKS